jgi:hypothetical protein
MCYNIQLLRLVTGMEILSAIAVRMWKKDSKVDKLQSG